MANAEFTSFLCRFLDGPFTGSTDALYGAVTRLLPLLDESAECPTIAHFNNLLSDSGIVQYAATIDDNGVVVGLATVAVLPLASGLRATIEDVVVDSDYRGNGIGRALVEHCVELAREAGCISIHLTSAPFREEANRLYQRLGFSLLTTNPYGLAL